MSQPSPTPYFEGPKWREATRRLLLISYHFPPSIAVGGLRWQRFSAHAWERGYGVTAIALDPAELRRQDPGRLEKLPPTTQVYGVPQRSPAIERLERALVGLKRRWTRNTQDPGSADSGAVVPAFGMSGGLTLTRHEMRQQGLSFRTAARAFNAWYEVERERAWAADAAELGIALARQGRISAVITCGPPHWVHEAGRHIAAATDLPLILDFRDPWSLQQRLNVNMASRLWYRLAARDERRAVRRAALTICNTEPLREAMHRLYPTERGRIITVMNGYDDDPIPPAGGRVRFLIAYAGAIYLDRDPRPLFRAAANVARSLSLVPEQFGLEFMGAVGEFRGQPVRAIAEAEGLGPYLKLHPPGTHAEALRFLAGAAMLVSLPQDSDLAIPSKVFEYMRFPAWLLALARPESATGRLLAGSPADLVAEDDVEGITRILAGRFAEFQRGVRPRPVAEWLPVSRAEQARILFDAIERILPAQSKAVASRR